MASIPRVKLDEMLLSLITERGFNRNRKKVCSEVGISESALTQFVHGRAKPSFDTLVRIAEFFEVTLDYLVFGRERDTRETDYDPLLSYMDHVLANILTKTDRRTWLFTRIAQALQEKIAETAAALEGKLSMPPGLLTDDETMRLEERAEESWILSLNLQYDIVKADSETEAAGRFLPIVSRNISLRRKYKFLLPRIDREWAPVVGAFRKVLIKQGIGSTALSENCEFRVVDAPILSGAGLYKLDIDEIKKAHPVLWERIREYTSEKGWLGYIIPPSMEPQADALMDLWHLNLGLTAFEALWKRASPI